MSSLRRRWGGNYELVEMLEAMPGGTILATRDFALLTLAGHLSDRFPGQLIFKGGFILRHVHGHLRFSKDIDATRRQPAGHKLDGNDVADAIRQASIRNVVAFIPDEPATDSARSLDFDRVRVEGQAFPATSVQVEVSYREAVVDEPVEAFIGEPFYEPFPILAMTVEEMAAEKLRALAQRLRATDLADLAVMLRDGPVNDADIRRLAETKFALVAAGNANRVGRIEEYLRELASTYDDVIGELFPEAPNYREANEIVWPRIGALIP